MAYKQLKPFYPNDMGKRKGWCLENVARGFHIYGVPSGLPSAKADMEFNRSHGTLHPLSTIPNYVSVPVYLDTASKYEHVEVCDKGTYWSDGYVVAKPTNSFGWGEYCNGVRIVEWQNDPQPTGFLPPRGWWQKGDSDPRINELCHYYADNFYAYFCNSAAAAHRLLDGPYFGNNCEKWTKEFQRRTKLKADGCVGPITYNKLKEYGFKG